MTNAEPGIDSRMRAWGYAGALPFVALAVAAWIPAPEHARWMPAAFVAWSAVILAFLGATWWGLVLAGARTVAPPRAGAVIVVSVLPSAVAVLALLLPLAAALAVLAGAHLLFRWLERLPSHRAFYPPWYERLRARLTWLVVVTHVAMFTWVTTGFHA